MKEAKGSKHQTHKKQFVCKDCEIEKLKKMVNMRKKLKKFKKQVNDKVPIIITSLGIIIPSSCMSTLV